MFSRMRYYLTDYRVLAAIGIVSAAAIAMFGADGLRRTGLWLLALLVLLLLVAAAVWLVRRLRARRAAQGIDRMVAEDADRAVAHARPAAKADTEALRTRMMEAVAAIKSSRIGVLKGKAALYELPWYVIIGNPAAGKSSAILNSGLKFPFGDSRGNVIQGIGGTRNCDWYFTTEGIVLDTAGRYSVSVEDRLEWLTFLDLLKKNRPRAPLNGILIAASIAEISGSRPEFAIELAKSLRQRVQEITERLEVFAPVYVVFTKADLIAGFTEFFRGLDPAERENVWGATLPFEPEAATDALGAFDAHFDELADGLKEMSLSQMAMQRGGQVSPGLLTLPLEFAAIKPALRTFIATLFEDNPYQFKPVFRGFYFTSALQEGHSVHYASERVSREFALQPARDAAVEPSTTGHTAHFLKDLFRKVIFADRGLVQQYSSPRRTRLRYAVFLGSVAALALALGGWAWSYTTHRQLVENASRDLEQAVRVQEGRVDLQSRLQALSLLQDRLEQLARHRQSRGIASVIGMDQSERIERKLRDEYFHGMRQVMLAPTSARLESFLADVAAGGGLQEPATAGDQAQAQEATLYQEASPDDANDAYNALKTYLMLGNRGRVEQAHLAHQLTRFWRGWLEANRGQMSREEMARSAEKLLGFYVAQADDPAWPQLDTRVALVADSREALRQVMKGQPAIERVFAQIKARAATRFPTITVASLVGEERNGEAIAGSYAISGAFSRKAWEDYVRAAFDEAAGSELSTTDWVLDTTEQSDLSLAGSPEHISRQLAALYKQEYAQEWQKFLQGVSVNRFEDFDAAVARMNSLGDPQNSPLRALLEAINEQTVWDNPAALRAAQGPGRGGFVAWFQRVVLRRAPSSLPMELDPGTGQAVQAAMGPVGKTFEGFARLLGTGDGPALIDSYFQTLGKLRSRLNAIRTEGEPGPGARRLMQDTLGNDGSELNAALALVDEQMLNGLDETQRNALRPLLLRPLTETFAALVAPTEAEINRVWAAQVYQPFRDGIGRQFPFDQGADVDAAPGDVAAIFGSSGAVAGFNRDALGALVIQRGNLLEPRRWAGMGITLSPELVSGYGDWVSGSAAGAGGQDTTIFQIQPAPAIGAVEYTLEIDGQAMRYRNTPPTWTTFQWPNPGQVPGAQLSVVTSDGRTVRVVDAPGSNGFVRLMEAARVESRPDSSSVTWSAEGISITVDMRITRRAGAASGSGEWQRGLQLPSTVAGEPDTTATAATDVDASMEEGA